VYAAIGSEVTTVIIDGRIVMQDGQIQTIDENASLRNAQRAADQLLDRARIPRPMERPWRPFAF